MDDITTHLAEKFPEMESESMRKLALSALQNIGMRATSRVPIGVNVSSRRFKKGLGYYLFFMPSVPDRRYHKVLKAIKSGRSKRTK